MEKQRSKQLEKAANKRRRKRVHCENCRGIQTMLSISISSHLNGGCSCSASFTPRLARPCSSPCLSVLVWMTEMEAAQVPVATKGTSPRCIHSLRNSLKNPSQRVCGFHLGYLKNEWETFCRCLFTQPKDVDIDIRPNLTKHFWESLQRNRAF